MAQADIDDDVRIGIVGLGGMGTTHAGHASGLGATIVGGADVVPDARSEFAEEFGVETYEEFEAMYDEADPDGVVITTPNKFHEPAATAALERDINVLCEKPLAASLEAAESIHEAAHDSAAFCMVGFHSRFSGAAQAFTEFREAGEVGDVQHVEANYVRRRGIPGVGSWFTTRDLSGGGSVIDVGVHAIDYALYLAGYPEPVEVSAVTRSEFGTRGEEYVDPDGWSGMWDTEDTFDVDDSASALVRCADGTTVSLEVSWAANRESEHTFHVWGTEMGMRSGLGGDDLTLLGVGKEGTDHYEDRELSGDYEPSGHEGEEKAFVEAVDAGEAPDLNTVDEGLTVQRVIDGIYRSSEANRAVEL